MTRRGVRGLRRATARVTVASLLPLVTLACSDPDPELIPDAVLQATLGLEVDQRVHTIAVTTGVNERSDPDSLAVLPGDFVEFVSTDWFIHEVRFDVDALEADARDFLERTDQMASPPLLQRDARFVVSFEGAPIGRYPYLLVGNRGSGGGEVVVTVSTPPSR